MTCIALIGQTDIPMMVVVTCWIIYVKKTSDLIGHDVSLANHKAVHGWCQANIDQQYDETSMIDQKARIDPCGDWFIQGRVEAAFPSGCELVNPFFQGHKRD